jgi:HlyD family secretion protein
MAWKSQTHPPRGKDTAMPDSRFRALGRLSLIAVIGASAWGVRRARADDPPVPGPRPQATQLQALTICSEVEGKTTLLQLIPNASHVKKGDVLCELDSGPIRERLNEQTIVIAKAKQELDDAAADLLVAKARQAAYVQDTLGNEEAEVTKELSVARDYEAQAKLELAKLSKRLPAEEYPVRVAKQTATEATVWRKQTEAALAAFNVKKAAKTRVYVIAIERAQTNLKLRYASSLLEQAKLDKLKTQLEKCTIEAPCAGRVAIAGPSSPHSPPVMEGELVREKQLLMRILPDPPTAELQ